MSGKSYLKYAKKINSEAGLVQGPQAQKRYGNAVKLKPSFGNLPLTKQEQHPDLKTSDRLIIKNFSNSPESSVAYLQQQYPDHEIKLNGMGQLLMRKKGEMDYGVVDPDTGLLTPDIVKDAGDVAYDVAAGGVESLAALGGATAGAAMTLPALGTGAIPAAMAASGAVGAGDEALRQKLGQALGIPQSVDMTDVAIAGGLSAVSPMLAGAGKARGLLAASKDFATKKALPKLGSMISGVSAENLMNYSDDALRAQLKQLEQSGIDDFAGSAFDKLKNYVETRKDDAGEALVRAIDETGAPVNMSQAKNSYAQAIRDLESRPNLTNVEFAKINKLKSDYQKYYGLADPAEAPVLDVNTMQMRNAPTVVPDEATARRAWDLQKDLKQAAKFDSDISPENVYSKGTARDSYFKINDALDQASGGVTSNAKTQYKSALDAEAELLPKFEGSTRADSIQKTYNMLSNMDTQGRTILKERLSKLSDSGALDLSNEAKVLSTFRELGNPKLMPISSGGTTSTSRTIPAAAAGGLVGGYTGNQAGITGQPGIDSGLGALGGATLATLAGSPSAMKNYIRMHRMTSKGLQTLNPLKEQELARRAIRSSWMDMLIDPDTSGE